MGCFLQHDMVFGGKKNMFTQEQVDQMIAEKVKEAKTGLFTEDELNRRLTAEVDRRVESGIQKGLATQRTKWEEEFAQKAKMTAEELAKQQLDEQMKTLSAKELEIKKKANLIEAKDMLSSASIPKSHYENFINILVSDDSEGTMANVQNFITMFNNTKTEIETKVKSEFSNVKPPTTGGTQAVTKEDFKKLGYAEKLKFKVENPEMYKEFMK